MSVLQLGSWGTGAQGKRVSGKHVQAQSCQGTKSIKNPKTQTKRRGRPGTKPGNPNPTKPETMPSAQ